MGIHIILTLGVFLMPGRTKENIEQKNTEHGTDEGMSNYEVASLTNASQPMYGPAHPAIQAKLPARLGANKGQRRVGPVVSFMFYSLLAQTSDGKD